MAVYSMTGYASVQLDAAAQAESGNPARLGLEIRAVNGRFLDLNLRLSDELRTHEPLLRELVQTRIKRGKLELRAYLESATAGTVAEPNPRLLQRLGALQDSVQSWLPEARALSVADVLKLAAGEQGGTHDWGPALQALASQALDALVEARRREGERLAAMLQGHIAQLRPLSQQAAPLVPQLVEQQRQRFLERWKEAMALTEGAVPPQTAQERALTEATAYAIRIDVAEELTRLASHLDEIERLLKKGGEVGKRLDFLIQELHREANTLGSKSATLELTRISVDMKVLVEQMREQVQNLE
jgi:uncharacterized protein (TIGR00255 family)